MAIFHIVYPKISRFCPHLCFLLDQQVRRTSFNYFVTFILHSHTAFHTFYCLPLSHTLSEFLAAFFQRLLPLFVHCSLWIWFVTRSIQDVLQIKRLLEPQWNTHDGPNPKCKNKVLILRIIPGRILWHHQK